MSSCPYLKSPLRQLTVLALGFATVLCSAAVAETKPERLWLAERYDSTRILVYFDTVRFNGTIPPEAQKITCPNEVGLFCPVKLPPSYVAGLQKKPGAEHFVLGEKYDLLIGNSVATVTLTTLVGYEGDEGTDNESFIGALGTIEQDQQDWLYGFKGYTVVRHHPDLLNSGERSGAETRTVYAGLLGGAVQFDIQAKIVELMNERMRSIPADAKIRGAESISPLFTVQQFRLADGSIRYYAQAGWNSDGGKPGLLISALGAWISPTPSLHVLAVESAGDFSLLPDLVNVIDLLDGKTAIVTSFSYEDGGSLDLYEYRDGLDLHSMPHLQSIGAGE